MNQNWNADNYSSSFSFVYNYGKDVLSLIEGDDVHDVVDLGCGTGTLTHALAEKGYNVLGLDASSDMLAKARANYPSLRFMQADATDFRLESQVDAVFSNAVLHWIDRARQPKMMRCVYDALRPGGQFVFEMGGVGCGKMIHDGLAKSFSRRCREYVMPFFFPTVGEYASMLEDSGFTVRYALLFDRPTKLAGTDGLADWIRMFVNIPFTGIADDEKDGIIHETVDGLREKLCVSGQWYADYVRLRMRALK